MKKIFALLISCAAILFSCNMNMTSGDTDLIVHLPGSEGRVAARYDESDVVSYRIDLTNDDGDYYSETGVAGGTIVFKNILSGTYKVNIWGLDSNTFVAAKTSTTIRIFKGEENYLSADALLGYVNNKFFVSVPKGVWNLNHASCFRDAQYYNAVRDVDFDFDENEKVTAQITNPDVEYAYINTTYGGLTTRAVESNNSYEFSAQLKAERKSTFFISIYDSLCEEYGKTEYIEYDPNEGYSQNGFKQISVTYPNRGQSWHPIVRIGFTRECGKVEIQSCMPFISTDITQLNSFSLALGTPVEKHAVTVSDGAANSKKFTFSKSKAGGQSMSVIIPSTIQWDGAIADYRIKGLKVNKNVQKLSITGKSFASKKNLFSAELKDFQLDAGREYNFIITVPAFKFYSVNQWENAYIEIKPEGYDGDELEMDIESFTIYGDTQMPNIKFSGTVNLSDYNGYDVPNILNNIFLQPGESKVIGGSYYPDCSNPDGYQYMNFKCDTVYVASYLSQDYYVIPAVVKDFENTCQNVTFYKVNENEVYIKNDSAFDKVINLQITDNKLSFSDESIYKYQIKTFKDIQIEENYKKVKVASFDAKSYSWETGSFSKIYFTTISGIPVLGKASEVVSQKKILRQNADCGNAFYRYVVRTKDGQILSQNVDMKSSKVTGNVLPYLDDYYYLMFDYHYPPVEKEFGQSYSKDDLVIDVYLCWDKTYEPDVDMVTLHDFKVSYSLVQ